MATMSAADIVTIISAVTISITTVLGAIVYHLKSLKGSNDRMEEQNARIEASALEQVRQIKKIEQATNGMKDDLVAAARLAAFAEGRASALAEAKQAEAESKTENRPGGQS